MNNVASQRWVRPLQFGDERNGIGLQLLWPRVKKSRVRGGWFGGLGMVDRRAIKFGVEQENSGGMLRAELDAFLDQQQQCLPGGLPSQLVHPTLTHTGIPV